MASFYPKQNSIFRFKNDYVRHDRGKNNNILSTAGLPRPSLHSIQKAFEYYNNQKHTDYSAFVTMGYALISKEHLIISNTPQEPIRFFPANIKD